MIQNLLEEYTKNMELFEEEYRSLFQIISKLKMKKKALEASKHMIEQDIESLKEDVRMESETGEPQTAGPPALVKLSFALQLLANTEIKLLLVVSELEKKQEIFANTHKIAETYNHFIGKNHHI